MGQGLGNGMWLKVPMSFGNLQFMVFRTLPAYLSGCYLFKLRVKDLVSNLH